MARVVDSWRTWRWQGRSRRPVQCRGSCGVWAGRACMQGFILFPCSGVFFIYCIGRSFFIEEGYGSTGCGNFFYWVFLWKIFLVSEENESLDQRLLLTLFIRRRDSQRWRYVSSWKMIEPLFLSARNLEKLEKMRNKGKTIVVSSFS